MVVVDLSESKPRRWPVVLAAAAVLSLFGLAFFAPTEERTARQDHLELLHIRDDILNAHEYTSAASRLRSFITDHPNSRWKALAHFLLARAMLGRAGEGPFPGSAVVDVALSHLDIARTEYNGAEIRQWSHKILNARRLAGRIFGQAGLFDKASRLLEGLYQMEEEGLEKSAILLDLSRVRARHALADPGRAEELYGRSLLWVNDYMATRKGKELLPGYLQKARVYWQMGKFHEMRKVIKEALDRYETLPKKERGDIQDQLIELRYERGRALSKIGKLKEALEDLEFVQKTSLDFRLRDLADIHRIAIYGIQHDPEAQRRAMNLIRSGSPFRELARILLGRFFLETKRAQSFETMLLGFENLKNVEGLRAQRIDIDGLYRAIRAAWGRSRDGETLVKIVKVLERLRQLYPNSLRYWKDTAAVYALAAQRLVDLARARERVGDQAAGRKFRRRSRSLFYRSGDRYIDITRQRGVSPDVISESFRVGADSYFAGGWFIKAAKYYRNFYMYRVGENHAGLYREALSYARANVFQSEYADERNAVVAFSEYIRLSPTGTIYVARALLERGNIFLKLGLYTDAATDFDLVTSRRDSGLGPMALEWSEALRLRGVAEMERAAGLKHRTSDPAIRSQFVAAVHSSQRALAEYVYRYVESSEPHHRGLRAAFDLARLHMIDEDWVAAERRLLQVLSTPSRMKPDGRLDENAARLAQADADEALLRAHFLLGEVQLTLGKNQEAYDAFEFAYSQYVARPERLWGLIGQARSALRLGRDKEGKRLYQSAQELYEKNTKTYEDSLAGFGRIYWMNLLKVLETEIR